jgi:uncharacterized protein YuzE
MKVTYDRETDTLRLVFREVQIAESDEERPGLILDYDDAGELISMELLDASRRVENPKSVEFIEVA